MPLIIYLGFAVRRYVILLSQYYVVEGQTRTPLQVNVQTERDLRRTQVGHGVVSALQRVLTDDEVSGGHEVLDEHATLIEAVTTIIVRRQTGDSCFGPVDTGFQLGSGRISGICGSKRACVRIELTDDVEDATGTDDVVLAPEVLTRVVHELETYIHRILALALE